MLVDSHAHLDFIEGLDGALESAQEAGVFKIVTIGTSIDCSKKCLEMAADKSTGEMTIYASAGIHPKDGKGDIHQYGSVGRCIEKLRGIVKNDKKCVAIGECGLDYFGVDHKRGPTSSADKKFQRELFEVQIELAQELNLPLIVHCRNAWSEIFNLISNVQFQMSNFKLRGVFHCWTGDWEAAKKALELGFYISFSGIVTFKNAQDIQEVAKKTPLDRILLETDSPFLSPEPIRSTQGKPGQGKQNAPENVRIIGEFVASLRNETFAQIAQETSANAARLFNF